jgi:hypothetical protein
VPSFSANPRRIILLACEGALAVDIPNGSASLIE